MENYRIYLILLIVFLLFSSCNDDSTKNDTDNGETFYNAWFFLQCGYHDILDKYEIWPYGMGIYLNNNDSLTYNGGDMIISDAYFKYNYEYENIRRATTYGSMFICEPDSGELSFGAWTKWGLTGNAEFGIPPVEINHYTPEKIRLELPDTSKPVDISQDLLIKWNKDPNNEIGVKLSIFYKKNETTYASIFDEKVVPDTGELIVEKDSLEIAKEKLRITVSRDNIESYRIKDMNFVIMVHITDGHEYIIK